MRFAYGPFTFQITWKSVTLLTRRSVTLCTTLYTTPNMRRNAKQITRKSVTQVWSLNAIISNLEVDVVGRPLDY